MATDRAHAAPKTATLQAGVSFGRPIFIHLRRWEVLPFLTIQRQRCVKFRILRAQDFYTPLPLNFRKGQHLPALVVYKNQSPIFAGSCRLFLFPLSSRCWNFHGLGGAALCISLLLVGFRISMLLCRQERRIKLSPMKVHDDMHRHDSPEKHDRLGKEDQSHSCLLEYPNQANFSGDLAMSIVSEYQNSCLCSFRTVRGVSRALPEQWPEIREV